MLDNPLALASRFPRASRYHPEWLRTHASGGSPSLCLVEWLAAAMDLRPGQRVLDLGCGKACSSIFLRREFGVQVWATDLWFSASENFARIRDAQVDDGVFPLHADARSLPFARDFFDAILCVDSLAYFGTDDLYLNYLASFAKPGGYLALVGSGLTREIPDTLPSHLREVWAQDYWALHSVAWWKKHWERTGIVDICLADHMSDGWQLWLDWLREVNPDNTREVLAIKEDAGQFFTYIRMVAQRRGEAALEEYCWPDNLRCFPSSYSRKPLLRGQEGS